MPESVADRCTKSHEYIFLLSKSQHYYFNAEAIKEKSIAESGTAGKWNGNRDLNLPHGQTRFAKPNLGGSVDGFRNKRDVWVVTTKPFKESHFATFPEDLITPCILAGCPKEGVVLDPFMGAGTTALVALRNRRNYIGFELNPEYCELIERRLEQNRIGWGQLGISDLFSEER
jgi:site-specific DNA-methyltransferase (adenine-specific)